MPLTEAKCANCGAKLSIDMAVKTVVCQFCDSTFINEKANINGNDYNENDDGQLRVGKTVFARWEPNGYYYPAIISEVLDNRIKAAFLDGCSAVVANQHVLSLQEGYDILAFQGNWKHGGIFFKGVIANHNPMVMNYNDGDVEIIQLDQLRGVRPGEKVKRFFGLFG